MVCAKSSAKKLPGYTKNCKPEFSSTATDFRVILKNVNYHLSQSIMDTTQVKTQVKTQVEIQGSTFNKIVTFCLTPHSKIEIAEFCGYKSTKSFTNKYLRPLLDSGILQMTIPDKPNSRNPKYIAVHSK